MAMEKLVKRYQLLDTFIEKKANPVRKSGALTPPSLRS
jgi:hypothetical protein